MSRKKKYETSLHYRNQLNVIYLKIRLSYIFLHAPIHIMSRDDQTTF